MCSEQLGLSPSTIPIRPGGRRRRAVLRRHRHGPAAKRSCPRHAARPCRRPRAPRRCRRRPRRSSTAPRRRCTWPSASPSSCGRHRPWPADAARPGELLLLALQPFVLALQVVDLLSETGLAGQGLAGEVLTSDLHGLLSLTGELVLLLLELVHLQFEALAAGGDI